MHVTTKLFSPESGLVEALSERSFQKLPPKDQIEKIGF